MSGGLYSELRDEGSGTQGESEWVRERETDRETEIEYQ